MNSENADHLWFDNRCHHIFVVLAGVSVQVEHTDIRCGVGCHISVQRTGGSLSDYGDRRPVVAGGLATLLQRVPRSQD